MKQKKKRGIFTAFMVILVAAVLGCGGWFAYTVYNSTLVDLRQKVADQATKITNLEADAEVVANSHTTAYCLKVEYDANGIDTNKVYKAGYVITEKDVAPVEVTKVSTPANAITKLEDIVGKSLWVDCYGGTCLTTSILYDNEIKADIRELDVVLDEVPIALELGDYVDIRISFPLGQDFVALTNKKVLGIYNNVIKILVNETDLHVYESMKADTAIYAATKMYAVKQLEVLQGSATSYYPVSLIVLDTMALDSNMSVAQYDKIADARLQLEEQLNTSTLVDFKSTVTQDKEALVTKFNDAKTAYQSLYQSEQ